MKQFTLAWMLLSILTLTARAQNLDTLLYERFETGGTTFTLNTATLGGQSAAVGYNQWIVNNAYAGGSGQITCLGFPFTFNVATTPAQPAATTGGLNTGYLHTVSDASQASGVNNCCYLAADGICYFSESYFSQMTQDINTIGYDSVTISFLWLCAGGTNIYGEVYYSIDQGVTWVQVSYPISQYKNQSTWTTQAINLPAFAGNPTIRFGFRFVNNVSGAANDPGFGIDEFMITGKEGTTAPLTANFSVSDSSICVGECVDFYDQSLGIPTSWFYIFQGANTAFSTNPNPTQICYPNPGTYSVTLIISDGQTGDTLTLNPITVNPNPATPLITFSGDTLFATPGFAGYQWYLNNNPIPGADSSSHVTLTNGAYSVAVTDSNGCSAISDTLNFTTGLLSLNGNASMVIYPNPATQLLTIHAEQIITNIKIRNLLGEEILIAFTPSTHVVVDVQRLPAGVYFVEIITETGKRVMRVIKE